MILFCLVSISEKRGLSNNVISMAKKERLSHTPPPTFSIENNRKVSVGHHISKLGGGSLINWKPRFGDINEILK